MVNQQLQISEKVSVIMPAYNAEKFISESISSVLAQTYPHWELIIVDDGSTDATAEIVNKYKCVDNRITYVYQQNQRIGVARNTGIRMAQGVWIAFLDADDLWMPEKIQLQLLAASEHLADVVFTGGYLYHEPEHTLNPYPTLSGLILGNDLYKKQFFTNYIPVLSVMLKASWVKMIGFQEENPLAYGCEDYDYWFRLCNKNARFYGIDENLFKYRVHSHGISRDLLVMYMAECYVLHKNLNLRLFNSEEKNEVLKRFTDLFYFIIPKLYQSMYTTRIPFFLNIARKITGKSDYLIALIAYWILKGNSEKRVGGIILKQQGVNVLKV